MDKETYEGVFLTTDWDAWCGQFIKEKKNVDTIQSEPEGSDR